MGWVFQLVESGQKYILKMIWLLGTGMRAVLPDLMKGKFVPTGCKATCTFKDPLNRIVIEKLTRFD